MSHVRPDTHAKALVNTHGYEYAVLMVERTLLGTHGGEGIKIKSVRVFWEQVLAWLKKHPSSSVSPKVASGLLGPTGTNS